MNQNIPWGLENAPTPENALAAQQQQAAKAAQQQQAAKAAQDWFGRLPSVTEAQMEACVRSTWENQFGPGSWEKFLAKKSPVGEAIFGGSK